METGTWGQDSHIVYAVHGVPAIILISDKYLLVYYAIIAAFPLNWMPQNEIHIIFAYHI